MIVWEGQLSARNQLHPRVISAFFQSYIHFTGMFRENEAQNVGTSTRARSRYPFPLTPLTHTAAFLSLKKLK